MRFYLALISSMEIKSIFLLSHYFYICKLILLVFNVEKTENVPKYDRRSMDYIVKLKFPDRKIYQRCVT
jgi:hypothetical protein